MGAEVNNNVLCIKIIWENQFHPIYVWVKKTERKAAHFHSCLKHCHATSSRSLKDYTIVKGLKYWDEGERHPCSSSLSITTKCWHRSVGHGKAKRQKELKWKIKSLYKTVFNLWWSKHPWRCGSVTKEAASKCENSLVFVALNYATSEI